MTKVKASFENQKVYVGLDIHKRSWNAAIYLNDQFIRNIHQPPQPQALHVSSRISVSRHKFSFCLTIQNIPLIECLVLQVNV